jgi:hypothetical protein
MLNINLKGDSTGDCITYDTQVLLYGHNTFARYIITGSHFVHMEM